MDAITLLKYLMQANLGSRRFCFNLITTGEIRVNDTVEEQPLRTIKKTDRVYYNNKQIIIESPDKNLVYIMLNKPAGYISASKDQDNKPSILRLIRHKNLKDLHLFPVGRLDFLTEGLIFITNDGDFAHYLTHPANLIEKHYLVEIKGTLTPEDTVRLKKGVFGRGILYKVKNVKVLSTGRTSRLIVVLEEGKNREIRNIFAILRHKIKYLKRIQIHTIRLDNKLKPGQYKLISRREILKSFPLPEEK